jgi:hypothetical protein
MDLLRPLFEAWLLEASQNPLPAWQRSLLAWALRHDEALRCLAVELAEFSHEEAPEAEAAPDLRPRLHAHIAGESLLPEERPLFPNVWIPAGGIAVLLVTAWVALAVHPVTEKHVEDASAQSAKAAEELALTSTPTPVTATASVTNGSAGALSASAANAPSVLPTAVR